VNGSERDNERSESEVNLSIYYIVYYTRPSYILRKLNLLNNSYSLLFFLFIFIFFLFIN
jgi:hypothetical protein